MDGEKYQSWHQNKKNGKLADYHEQDRPLEILIFPCSPLMVPKISDK